MYLLTSNKEFQWTKTHFRFTHTADCYATKTTLCMWFPLLFPTPAEMEQQVGACKHYDLKDAAYKGTTLTLIGFW